MNISLKTCLTNTLISILANNGPEYPAKHPSEFLEVLIDACGENTLAAAMYYLALNGIFDDAMAAGIDVETLTAKIQSKGFFKKAYASELAEILMEAYSPKNLKRAEHKKGSGFQQICNMGEGEWHFCWEGQADWHSDGGTAVCHGSGGAYLQVTDQKKLKKWLQNRLQNYPYSTLPQIKDVVSEYLSEKLDADFDDYCNEDDYYQPVAEDFEFDYYLTAACKSLGIIPDGFIYDGECDDWEPDTW